MDKTHILNEIKRTAAANGGVALGQNRFETETGIKQTDWYGKHWARWRDALRESGFAPNQLRSAFEEKLLLEKYARYAQELTRLPTSAELRLKARNDSGFPHSTTFRNRLGPKMELVEKLLEYCRSHSGLDDVIQMCENYLRSNTANTSDDAPSDEDVVIGFVYLIKSGRFYKIGKTNAIGRREYELAIQLPEKPETVHVIRTDDPDGIEEYWHKRFADKRKNGEWFELNTSDIAAFKRRKFM
jgi:hypothetical protein